MGAVSHTRSLECSVPHRLAYQVDHPLQMAVHGSEAVTQRYRRIVDGSDVIGEWRCIVTNGFEPANQFCQITIGTDQRRSDQDEVTCQYHDNDTNQAVREPCQ